MLAALDRSSYLAMKVLINQLLNQAPTGPNAFTNGGIMAYTGPCRDCICGKGLQNERQRPCKLAKLLTNLGQLETELQSSVLAYGHGLVLAKWPTLSFFRRANVCVLA